MLLATGRFWNLYLHLMVVFNSAVMRSAITNKYFNYILPCIILRSVVVCQRMKEIAEVGRWPVAVRNEAKMLGYSCASYLTQLQPPAYCPSWHFFSICADLVGDEPWGVQCLLHGCSVRNIVVHLGHILRDVRDGVRNIYTWQGTWVTVNGVQPVQADGLGEQFKALF